MSLLHRAAPNRFVGRPILAAAVFRGGFRVAVTNSRSRLKDDCRQDWPPYRNLP